VQISIVMPTYNNCFTLRRTLSHFCKLNVDSILGWELIIVANNCTDDTEEIARSYFDKLPIILHRQPKQGTTLARNTGVLNSSGVLIVFTDDDICPEPNWLQIYLRGYHENPSGYFWGGPVVSDFETTPPSSKLQRYAPPSVLGLDFSSKMRTLEENEYFIGANWACPRQAINEVGLFDVNMGLVATARKTKIGEETDYMDRLRKRGYRALYLPEARITHFVPKEKTTLRHIASRKEASEYFSAMNEFTIQGMTRVPRWMYRKVIENWLSWQLSKITMRDCTDEYMQYRAALGRMRAAHDCVKNGPDKNT
jgi:glucosyl-dolichyl phosphate glucuronosyltransferase